MPYVYRYTDLNDGFVKYIGISKNEFTLQRRMKNHPFDSNPMYSWQKDYFETASQVDAEAWEAHLITEYKTYVWLNKAKSNWGKSEHLDADSIVWKSYGSGEAITGTNTCTEDYRTRFTTKNIFRMASALDKEVMVLKSSAERMEDIQKHALASAIDISGECRTKNKDFANKASELEADFANKVSELKRKCKSENEKLIRNVAKIEESCGSDSAKIIAEINALHEKNKPLQYTVAITQKAFVKAFVLQFATSSEQYSAYVDAYRTFKSWCYAIGAEWVSPEKEFKTELMSLSNYVAKMCNADPVFGEHGVYGVAFKERSI